VDADGVPLGVGRSTGSGVGDEHVTLVGVEGVRDFGGGVEQVRHCERRGLYERITQPEPIPFEIGMQGLAPRRPTGSQWGGHQCRSGDHETEGDQPRDDG
jgi:hypothetical protein